LLIAPALSSDETTMWINRALGLMQVSTTLVTHDNMHEGGPACG